MFIFIIAAIIFYYLFGSELKEYYKDAQETVGKSCTQDFRQTETSYIYDKDCNELAALKSDKDVTYVEYYSIPVNIGNAFVCVEDRRFWQHNGIDLKSISKAAYLLVKNKGDIQRGASTITQQLARNMYLTHEVSYERKIKEIFLALELEKKYDKSEILEFYVNNIYFGNGYYGIGSAAKGYFNKTVDELSLSECAFLCAIPNNPTIFDPIKHKKITYSRRDKILGDMLEIGKITQEDYDKAVKEKIILHKPKYTGQNYDVSFAIKCATEELMKLDGFTFKYSFKTMEEYEEYTKLYTEHYDLCEKQLYSGGYKVYTTLNSKAQRKLQKIIDNQLSFSKDKTNGIYTLQGAATVIDNNTGKVIAIVGGRSQKKELCYLNRAFQSKRQPGSTIKPLIVYTPSLENGYQKNSIVNDTYFEGGPKNAGSYSGQIPLYYAVEQSKNVVAWRLFEELTPRKGLSYLQKMKFSSIVPNDYYLPASLGGLYYGVSSLEMASGYATIANHGVYREATCIKSILDTDGNDLVKKQKGIRVYSKNAAINMTDILTGVVKRGTAHGLGWSSEMPCAAKTGTTNNNNDGWFCGFTPYYTISVWVGCDNNSKISGLWGSTYPGQIWKDMQLFLIQNKKVKDFDLTLEPEVTDSSTTEVTKVTTSEQSTTENIESTDNTAEIDKLLADYSKLRIDSKSQVEQESILYNNAMTLIKALKDSKLREIYLDKLNNLESIKSKEIYDFLNQNSTE